MKAQNLDAPEAGQHRKPQLILLVASILWIAAGLSAATETECNLPVPDIYNRVSPSVVGISATRIDPFRLMDRFSYSSGTGVVIQPDGLLLTCAHVVYNTRSITVTMHENQTAEAVLIGADPILDIAVLKISDSHMRFTPAPLGDSGRLRVGEEVIAIGNSLGIENTLVHGIVSGLNRILPVSPMSLRIPLIQTDVAVYPGNSGGPLVNRCGKVVGIITSMMTDTKMSFALPINAVTRALSQLIDKGRVVRPWLGIRGRPIAAKDLKKILSFNIIDGYLVETVDPESPAETAGIIGGDIPIIIAGEEFLMGGDIIYAINGRPLSDPAEFNNVIQSLKIDDTVRLNLYRDGKRFQVDMTVSERPILPDDYPQRDSSAYP